MLRGIRANTLLECILKGGAGQAGRMAFMHVTGRKSKRASQMQVRKASCSQKSFCSHDTPAWAPGSPRGTCSRVERIVRQVPWVVIAIVIWSQIVEAGPLASSP